MNWRNVIMLNIKYLGADWVHIIITIIDLNSTLSAKNPDIMFLAHSFALFLQVLVRLHHLFAYYKDKHRFDVPLALELFIHCVVGFLYDKYRRNPVKLRDLHHKYFIVLILQLYPNLAVFKR